MTLTPQPPRIARRAKFHDARRAFANGATITVSEHGREKAHTVTRETVVHTRDTIDWRTLVDMVRQWKGRYPGQRFYIVDEPAAALAHAWVGVDQGEPLFPDGTSSANGVASDNVSARWQLLERGAVITASWCVIDLDERPADRHLMRNPDGARWALEQEIEWLTCTDLADPGGTETWAEYRHQSGDWAFRSEGDALAAAFAGCRGDMAMFTTLYGDWDGTPDGWTPALVKAHPHHRFRPQPTNWEETRT